MDVSVVLRPTCDNFTGAYADRSPPTPEEPALEPIDRCYSTPLEFFDYRTTLSQISEEIFKR